MKPFLVDFLFHLFETSSHFLDISLNNFFSF